MERFQAALERAATQLRETRQGRIGPPRADDRPAWDAARLAVQRAAAHGMSEYAIARTVGVDRMTIRSWLGKRSRQNNG